jgi:hypothetical protein
MTKKKSPAPKPPKPPKKISFTVNIADPAQAAAVRKACAARGLGGLSLVKMYRVAVDEWVAGQEK